jgi:hypothetical protein
MAVCALQALLTNCTELMSAMKHHQQGFWPDSITDIPGHWGIKRSFVVSNTFPDELTYKKFITHLRNALSHPTSPNKAPKHPTTGYTTLPDGSGVITRFCFTDSPWVAMGCIHSKASSSDKKKVKSTLDSLKRNTQQTDGLEVKLNGEKYQIYRGNEIYLPIFEAELSLSALTDLAIELANHLAQPIEDSWDGRTIQRLVA